MLTAFAVAALFLAGTAYAGLEETCRQCHGDPPGGTTKDRHHVFYPQYNCGVCHPTSTPLVTDCTICHGSDLFAAHPSCLTCHSNQVAGRRAVGVDFMASSRHVQTGTPPTVADCQVCHVTTLHMQGTVKLRSADDGSTITYANEASATVFCLSCHDDNSKTATPFSDLRTPVSSASNWDGKSVKIKYSTTEFVSSNKYPPTVAAPSMSGASYNTVPDIQRALSAHGNPGQNKANGTTSDVQVPCLACHNSHGSALAPLLFSTNTYSPENVENFCWDCHTNNPASPQKASNFMPGNWVKDYFGDPRWGLNAGSGFTVNWMGSFAYKNSSFMSSHFHPSKKGSGTTWPRSGLTCTDCHDPHGVDPGLTTTKAYMVPLLKGTWLISPFKEDRAPLASFASALRDGSANRYQNADQPRSAPDLAYNNTPNPGGGYPNGSGGAGHEGYFIDDNTFGVFNPTNNTAAVSGSWKSVIAAGQTLQMNRIAETDTQFAGLCLRCHPKTNLQAAWSGHGTVKGWGGAKRDLIPSGLAASGNEGPGTGMHAMGNYASNESEQNAPYGRGYRWGVNPKTQRTSGYIQADYHQFACSKCHTPHASNMPRLMVTNCLDSKGTHTTYSKSKSVQAANCHSTQRNLAWNTLTPWIQTASPATYTVMATSNLGGTISPAGANLVVSGTNLTLTIVPNSGYIVSDVKVNSVSQGARSSYTFTNVTSDQTISAIFVSTSSNITITASAGTGGTISPTGSVLVPAGSSRTFTITPNSGYAIADVKVDNVSQGALSTYTFTNVTAARTINATFVLTRNITASAGTGGTISPTGVVPVINGASQTFTITPNLGYKINQVLVNGVNQGALATYTFTNVTTTHTISATFSTTPIYSLTATAGTGGTISPAGVVQVNSGSGQSYTITPNTGYSIANVTVNGASQGAISSYTFTNVTANQTINATFALNTYTLSASVGTGGTITPPGTTVVNHGATQYYTIVPTAGYVIAGVKVDDVPQGAITSYTFANVSDNHTISATFTLVSTPKTIVASAATGGTITPSGNVIVAYGGSQSFTIAANYGYAIADVKVDDISRGPIASFTFTNVTANHSISVTYVTTLPSYIITSTAGTGGTVSPLGSIRVWEAGSQTFNIVPSAGYAISNVTVNGVPLGPIATYTFSGVTAPHSISATFVSTLPTHTITASAGTGGAITPSGSVVVTSGSNQTFSIAANSGYAISSVTVDGVSQGAISSYTFTNVTANHTISAAFIVPPAVNLALNKSASASSQSSSTYAASKAVDGSTSTYWRSSTTGTQWLRVDLGSSQSVNNVKVVWNGSYYARNFQIQTSTDGTNFTTQYTTSSGASGTANINFTAASARYVRLYCTTANSSSYRVNELEVYGGPPPPNQAPVANAGSDKTGYAGVAISFTGSGTDSDGTITGWSWNWGDGSANNTTQNASHTYAAAGSYIATLTVTDNLGATGSDTAAVTVSAAPAGVVQLDSWTNLYTAAPSKTSETNLNVGSFAVGSGSNRLLLVAVVMELSTAADKTISASYGGTNLTQVGLTAKKQREIVWVGRFNDAQIGSGSKTLTITYGGSGTVTGLHVKWASYSGVNQSSPVAGSAALNTSSTSSTTFGSTVNYVNGGMTMVVAGNGGSSATGTLSATPSFTAGTATQANSHTSRTFVTAKHSASGSYSSSTAVSWSSGSTGSGLVAVSLQP